MPVVINSNATATTALRNCSPPLSAGTRIFSPSNDAGGLREAFKLNYKLFRTEEARQNIKNRAPYLHALDSFTASLFRASEVGTVTNHLTKNPGDIGSYLSEFIESNREHHHLLNSNRSGDTFFCSNGGTGTKSWLPPNLNHGSNTKNRIDPSIGFDRIRPSFSYSLTTSGTGKSTDGLIPLRLKNIPHALESGFPEKGYSFIAVKGTDPRRWGEVLLLQGLIVSIIRDRIKRYFLSQTQMYRRKVLLHPKVFHRTNMANTFYKRRKLKSISFIIKLIRMRESIFYFVHSMCKFKYRMKLAFFLGKTSRIFSSLITDIFSKRLFGRKRTRCLPKSTDPSTAPVSFASNVRKVLMASSSKLVTSYFLLSRILSISSWSSTEHNSRNNICFYGWKPNLNLESSQNTFLTYLTPC
jgi:hypothetical protein